MLGRQRKMLLGPECVYGAIRRRSQRLVTSWYVTSVGLTAAEDLRLLLKRVHPEATELRVLKVAGSSLEIDNMGNAVEDKEESRRK